MRQACRDCRRGQGRESAGAWTDVEELRDPLALVLTLIGAGDQRVTCMLMRSYKML